MEFMKIMENVVSVLFPFLQVSLDMSFIKGEVISEGIFNLVPFSKKITKSLSLSSTLQHSMSSKKLRDSDLFIF
jgi:hypothetical protein